MPQIILMIISAHPYNNTTPRSLHMPEHNSTMHFSKHSLHNWLQPSPNNVQIYPRHMTNNSIKQCNTFEIQLTITSTIHQATHLKKPSRQAIKQSQHLSKAPSQFALATESPNLLQH